MRRDTFSVLGLVCLALSLAACSSASTQTNQATMQTDQVETTTVATSSSPAPTPSTESESPEVDEWHELNCSNIVVDHRLTDPGIRGWGLKEQVGVIGGTYTIGMHLTYHTDTRASVEINIDRGIACLAAGTSSEGYEVWTYVEFPASEQPAVDAWVQAAEANSVPGPNGTTVLWERTESGYGSMTSVTIGQGWAAWASGGLYYYEEDKLVGAFSGEFRDVDSNDAIVDDATTLTCSMFFGPLEAGASDVPVSLKTPGFTQFAEDNNNPFSKFTRSEENPMDTYCADITWHDEAGTAPSSGPVAENESCTLYEAGADEFIAICDEGWAEISGPLEYAKQVLPPKFRPVP